VAREYVFVDEWDVDAPQEIVYDIVADARTYPDWWQPVYISVEGDERATQHHFKGRLPYTLKMRAEMVREERWRGRASNSSRTLTHGRRGSLRRKWGLDSRSCSPRRWC
jgi:Polyketide cyclase / dehydrase and lipid transport